MQYVELQIEPFPISVRCYDNGLVSFNKLARFPLIIDQPEQGIQAIISEQDIFIGANTEISYGDLYEYKEIPELFSWIKALNIEMPNFKGI